jgi:PAS domain S-box-containing protein
MTEATQFHKNTVAMNEALILSSLRQQELVDVTDALNAKLRREITERKLAEATLHESEERYRALFEMGPVAIYSCDASGVIQDFNRRAVELWGREPTLGDNNERFCGSYKLFRPDGCHVPHEQCLMADVLSGKIPQARHVEVQVERPDGTRITAVANIRPLKNQRGEITGAINSFFDITERKLHEEQQELLLKEMDHRVKNLFAIVGGMVTLSARSATTPKELAQTVQGRLGALASAHQLIRPGHSAAQATKRATTLGELIRKVLSPYADPARTGDSERTEIDGPEIAVGVEAATNVALVVHELATNAAKYGALSVPGGRVDISWTVCKGRVALSWEEKGGPVITAPPEHEGFGSVLARKSVSGGLRGDLTFYWNPAGLVVLVSAETERLAL